MFGYRFGRWVSVFFVLDRCGIHARFLKMGADFLHCGEPALAESNHPKTLQDDVVN
jgi:hypothetical protein